jgi:hypothetical protein
MSKEIEICDGATISAAEVERVEEAMAQLEEDKGAAHSMTVTVSLRIHHEYPKTLYRGKDSTVVVSAAEEAGAAKDGFGPYDHEAFTAKEA